MTSIKLDNQVKAFIKAGKSDSDIIVFLTMNNQDLTKAEARTYLTDFKTANNLETVKKETKSGQLKAWFLAQPDLLVVTKKQIKDKCLELDMKGGSVTYYVNSYHLAIEVASQLASNK